MCQTHAPTEQPVTQAGTPLPAGSGGVGATAGAGPVGGDPLSAAIQAESAANPKTASVNAPTKFGKLLSFIAPIAAGAVVGGFAGRGHPGGGFGAANEFFTQKREQGIQDRLLKQQEVNANILNQYRQQEAAQAAARTQNILQKPNFPGGITKEVTDEATGKPMLLRQNSDTGVFEPMEGYTPFDKSADKTTSMMTDKGLVAANSTEGTAKPITLPGAPQSVATPVNSNVAGPGRFGGATASPQTVKLAAGPGIPLLPPGAANAANPKPVKVTNRGASGAESDSLIDENPKSPTFGQTLKKNVAGRAALPKEADKTRGEKEQIASDAERTAAAAMEKFNGDPDKAIAYVNSLKTGDAAADKHLTSILPLVRKSIRDRVAPGKKGKQRRLTADEEKTLVNPTAKSSVLEDDSDE